MSIDEPNKVDFTAIDKAKTHVLLVVSDHLDWSNEGEHLLMLQNKLNAYFALVESGELVQKLPAAKGLPVIIRIVGKYPLKEDAVRFFNSAKSEFAQDGITLEFELLKKVRE